MSILLDRLKKQSTVKESAVLTTSKFFSKKDMVQTAVPMINVALSGSLDGGLTPGLTMFAGPSKHFKTGFALTLASAYMKKYEDAVMVFYDSEFGTPQSYFDAFEIDSDRVLHVPITDMEQFKHDVMGYFDSKNKEGIKRGDHVIFVVDSIGNLASRKEVEDAIEGKSVADMTRAKQIKSIFRMITPHLVLKDIPMIVVNHTYKTMELYSKDVVGGGTGSYYSADNIFILGRQQEKDGDDLVGYNFIINVEKSRYVKEKSKIPIQITYEGGMSRWSGLLDLATESGHISKGKDGAATAYQVVNMETGEISEKKWKTKSTFHKDFWLPILAQKSFREFVEAKYQIGTGKIMSDDEIAQAYEEVEAVT
jgi:RecA/RadA recombinase